MQDLPKSTKVGTSPGGAAALEGLLAQAQDRDGYLEVRHEVDGNQRSGYIFLRAGVPFLAAVEATTKGGKVKLQKGKKVFKNILRDTFQKQSTLTLFEVKTKDLMAFEKRHKDMAIGSPKALLVATGTPTTRQGKKGRKATGLTPEDLDDLGIRDEPSKSRKKGKKQAVVKTQEEAVEKAEEKAVEEAEEEAAVPEPKPAVVVESPLREAFDPSKPLDPIFLKDQLMAWRRAGYRVNPVVMRLRKDQKKAPQLMAHYLEQYSRIEVLKAEFAALGIEDENILTEFNEIWRSLQKADELADWLATLAGRLEVSEVKEMEEPTFMLRLVHDLPIDTGGTLLQQSFDTFHPGTANRFPVAVAREVAEGGENAPNPLVLLGPRGWGKSHLLHAIAKAAQTIGTEVAYHPTERLARAFLERGAEGLGEAFEVADLILIDDLDLVPVDHAFQAALHEIIIAFIARGGRLVVSSEVGLEDVEGLYKPLRKALSHGVIATLHHPEPVTIGAIMVQLLAAHGLDLPPRVLDQLLVEAHDDPHRLRLLLRRLAYYARLVGTELNNQELEDLLRKPVRREGFKRVSSSQMRPGGAYLIREPKPSQAWRIFREKVAQGTRGLLISRTNPRRIDLPPRDQPFAAFWLTDRQGDRVDIIPPNLERMIFSLQDFLDHQGERILVLDGIEYLVSNTSFDAVLRFLRHLVDDLSESEAMMLISLAPGTLMDREQATLEREFEVLL